MTTENRTGQASSLGHMPTGQKWEFDAGVANVFEDMLVRSIPAYADMRKLTYEFARRHVRPHTAVVDIGCSRGEALAPLVAEFGAANMFVGLEVSKPMLDAARERFKTLSGTSIVDIQEHDLRGPFPDIRASVILSVLTMQFVPIEYRMRIIRDVHESLIAGGAFLFVEKVLGASAQIDAEQVEVYYDFKRRSGYTQEEIDRKRAALEGVMAPMPAEWNEQLLRIAGFREVDCYWRWANFAAWLAVKS